MCKDDASQKGTNVSASENPATSGKYALLEQYRGKKIGDIFQVDLRSAGGVNVLDWNQTDRDNLRHLLARLGIDPETNRFNVEFIKPDDPLAAGYYQLMAVKPLPASKKSRAQSPYNIELFPNKDLEEMTLNRFISEYAQSQWRLVGINLEKASSKPNGGGEYMAAFHMAKKGDILIIATSWIDIPGKKIVAS